MALDIQEDGPGLPRPFEHFTSAFKRKASAMGVKNKLDLKEIE